MFVDRGANMLDRCFMICVCPTQWFRHYTIYQSKIEGFFIDESQICAAGLPGTDSCKGDSGGPMMFLDSTSRYRIVGVTSFGTIKCDSSVPGVYSRVSHYREWIHSVIRA